MKTQRGQPLRILNDAAAWAEAKEDACAASRCPPDRRRPGLDHLSNLRQLVKRRPVGIPQFPLLSMCFRADQRQTPMPIHMLPLAAGVHHIEQAIQHAPHVRRPGATAELGGRDERFDQIELVVAERLTRVEISNQGAVFGRPHRQPPAGNSSLPTAHPATSCDPSGRGQLSKRGLTTPHFRMLSSLPRIDKDA